MIWPMLGGHVYPPCYWLAFPPWHVRLNSCYTMCEETGNIYHLIFTECLCVATFSRSSGSVSFLWFASSVISLATCVITLDRGQYSLRIRHNDSPELLCMKGAPNVNMSW